jgi:hypothetical protein
VCRGQFVEFALLAFCAVVAVAGIVLWLIPVLNALSPAAQ